MCGRNFLVQTRIRRTHATHTHTRLCKWPISLKITAVPPPAPKFMRSLSTRRVRPQAGQANYRRHTCKSRTRVYHGFAAINPSSRPCHTEARPARRAFSSHIHTRALLEFTHKMPFPISGRRRAAAEQLRYTVVCMRDINEPRETRTLQTNCSGCGDGDCIDSPK